MTHLSDDDKLRMPKAEPNGLRPETFADYFCIEDFKCVLRMYLELRAHTGADGNIDPAAISEKYAEFIKIKDMINE